MDNQAGCFMPVTFRAYSPDGAEFDNNYIKENATFQSDDPSIAYYGTYGPNGYLGMGFPGVGTTTIRAFLGGWVVSGQYTTQSYVTGMTMDGATQRYLNVGQQTTASVTRTHNGQVVTSCPSRDWSTGLTFSIDLLPVTWTAQPPIVTTPQTGNPVTFTAEGTGSTTVTARAGGLSATLGITVGSGSLSVSIDGPNLVKPTQTCGFFSNVTGGTPTSYQWRIGGVLVGTGSEVALQRSSSYTLTLQVWSADGQTATANKNVTVSSTAPNCFF
jgi:hypothetical protein